MSIIQTIWVVDEIDTYRLNGRFNIAFSVAIAAIIVSRCVSPFTIIIRFVW